MIRKLLFFILLLALIVAALPAVDGFLFKRYFYQRITNLNQNLGDSAKIRIEVSSYQMGWLHSQATIVLILKNETAKKYTFSLAPEKYEIAMTVDHGPLVKTERGIKIAYANTHLQMKIPYFEDSKITIENLYSIFSNSFSSRYSISQLNIPKFMHWEGLNGEASSSKNGTQRIISTTNIGKLNSIDTDAVKFDILPVQIYYEMTSNTAANTLSSQYRMITDGFSYTSSNTKTAMGKLLYSSTDELSNELYQSRSTLNITKLTLPLSETIDFDNILLENNVSGFKFINIDDSSDYSLSGLLFNHLTPSSKVTSNTAFDTTHGHTDIRISASDFSYKAKAKPASPPDQYSLTLQGQMPRELAQILLSNYFSLETAISGFASIAASKLESMNNGGTNSPQASPSASDILTQLVQQGFLVEKDNLYTINYSQKNDTATLNGTAVSNVDERYAALKKIFSPNEQAAPQPQAQPNGRKCLYNITNIYGEMVCGEYAEPEQPAAEPTPTPAAEPTPTPAAEPTPTPAAEPTPTPAAEPTPTPAAEPTPTPAAEPAPTPAAEPAPTPATEPTPTPAAEPTPAATPAPPQAAVAQPAAPAETYGCYWMQTTGQKTWWVLIKELDTKQSCFVMDSCNGGQGASHGQCFKWATSPDGAPQAW